MADAVPFFAASSDQSAVVPDPAQALTLFRALFSQGALIHFRAVSEPRDGRPAQNLHYRFDDTFPGTLKSFLEWCALDRRAAFFLPGTVKEGGTGKEGVQSLPCVLIDFDKGNPAENLGRAEELLGPATAVVESGGTTKETHAQKLHAYWTLNAPASDGDISIVCAVREELAKSFGGDLSFKQEAQIVRVPGSIHYKGTPTLVRLRSINTGTRVDLSKVAREIGIGDRTSESNVIPFNFDFSRDRPPAYSVDDLRDMDVETEGKSGVTRWEWFNLVAGAEIADVRRGRKTKSAALDYVRGKVRSHLERPEDWDDDRVTREFEALWRVDERNHGPLSALIASTTADAKIDLQKKWNANRFTGEAPKRRWLVEGLIPKGTAGVFAAVGDAGKSMMALKLANVIANYPTPKTTAESPAGISDTPNFFGHPVTGRGAAVVITCEDDEAEIHRRLETLDPTGSYRTPNSQLTIWPLLSDDGAASSTILTDGAQGPQPTQFWHDLCSELMRFDNLALVCLDPLTHFVNADLNDNNVAALLLKMLGRLAAKTGAVVMAIHHFAKAANPTSLRNARTAIRGAGALVDNGRWSLVLWEADEADAADALKPLNRAHQSKQAGLVYFGGLAKGNAPSAKTMRTFVRNTETGVLEDVTEELRRLAPQRDDSDAVLYAGLLKKRQADERFSFTASATKLWEGWGDVIRKHCLPITKDGKRKGKESIIAVFERMLDKGWLKQTNDTGAKRYEPVVIETGH